MTTVERPVTPQDGLKMLDQSIARLERAQIRARQLIAKAPDSSRAPFLDLLELATSERAHAVELRARLAYLVGVLKS